MFRLKFKQIFEKKEGETIAKETFSVNGMTFIKGTPIEDGTLGGVDFSYFKKYDIAVKERDGILVVRGFFK